MKHAPEHLIAIAEAQRRATKLATRRLQHRRRLAPKNEIISLSEQESWLAAVRRDDATDPALVTWKFSKMEEQPAYEEV